MCAAVQHAKLPGKLLMVGFGCIGQAVLPLLLRHLDLRPGQIAIVSASPYLGEQLGVHGDWTPLQGRSQLFAEDLDGDDPWQFKNFRVL